MRKYLQISIFLTVFSAIVVFKNKTAQKSAVLNTPIESLPPVTSIEHTAQSIHNSQNSSIYNDGTYTGTVENAFYGYIQTQVIIESGVIKTINFLQYPSDNRTSLRINTTAMPQWRASILKAQSAEVDIVSGASDSSAAVKRSVANALIAALK